MKFSVSSYSFRQKEVTGELSQIDMVDLAAKMGFDGIEFIDLVPCEKPTLEQQKEYAYKINARAKELGIEIAGYSIGANFLHRDPQKIQTEINRICSQAEVASILGAPVMRHDLAYSLGKVGNTRSFDLMLPTFADASKQITQFAEKINVKTCVENHGFVNNDSDRLERLFNSVAHENFGILIDIGNFLCVDENPTAAVSRLAPYTFFVHCKDFYFYDGNAATPDRYKFVTRGGNFIEGATIGDGDVPVKQCLRALKRASYDGFYSIEYEARYDCIENIQRGLQALKRFELELDEEQR